MFEDSLVESAGRIRTRSHRYVVGTTLLEAAVAATLVLIPYLYPDALPHRLLTVPLIAPPVTAAPVTRQASSPAVLHPVMLTALTAPSRIPARIEPAADVPPGPVGIPGAGPGTGVQGSLPWLGDSTAPPLPRVRLARPSGPLRVSTGAAEARLVAPIRPRYPAIALATHTQGWVIVDAVISTSGRVEDLRVVSGSPLLVPATIEAIRAARYRPFLLNGQPVEAETTISVHFTMN